MAGLETFTSVPCSWTALPHSFQMAHCVQNCGHVIPTFYLKTSRSFCWNIEHVTECTGSTHAHTTVAQYGHWLQSMVWESGLNICRQHRVPALFIYFFFPPLQICLKITIIPTATQKWKIFPRNISLPILNIIRCTFIGHTQRYDNVTPPTYRGYPPRVCYPYKLRPVVWNPPPLPHPLKNIFLRSPPPPPHGPWPTTATLHQYYCDLLSLKLSAPGHS
jgi:hypothetical protein